MKVKQRGLSGWQRLSLRALSLLAALMFVLAGSLVLRGTAHAQSSTLSVTVNSSAQVVNRVFLDVSGTDVCGPVPPGARVFSAFVAVRVTQTVDRSFITASGATTPICDGVVHTYQVEMFPTLFHGGPAFAQANLFLEFFSPTPPTGGPYSSCGPGCFFESAGSGLVSILITG